MCEAEQETPVGQPGSAVNAAQSCACEAAHEALHEETDWPATTSRQHDKPGPQFELLSHASAALPGAAELGLTLGHVVPVVQEYAVAPTMQQS